MFEIDLSLSGSVVAKAPTVHETRFYKAFGLVFASDIVLPELIELEPCPADVLISKGVSNPVNKTIDKTTWYHFEEDRAVLHWDAVGTFEVHSGREIKIEPAVSVADDLVTFPLLGPVLAVLLHQRGLLVLHASSVEFNGAGLCLLGDKGAGKSTTAGALVAAGNTLLTDDIVAIDCDTDGNPQILAGFPQLKLAVDACTQVSLADSVVLAQGHASIEKIRHRLMSGFSGNRAKLEKLYVLIRSDGFSAKTMSSDESLMALIRYSYMSRFGANAMTGNTVATHLRQCAKIANALKVEVLAVPNDLNRLGDLGNFLERHVK